MNKDNAMMFIDLSRPDEVRFETQSGWVKASRGLSGEWTAADAALLIAEGEKGTELLLHAKDTPSYPPDVWWIGSNRKEE